MKTKKASFFFLFIFIHTVVKAQVVPYERYTSKNGLISDRITAITQDEKGFMWFGSYFGACRYDGIKFEKIILPPQQQNKYITFLLPASNKMYAGFLFNSGLLEYNNGRSKAYSIKGADSVFANEFICAANGNDGNIILANSSNQVYMFKNGIFTHLYNLQQKSRSFIQAVQIDKYKNIWIATGQGLIILPFPYKAEQRYFIHENIFSMIKDQTQKIWFCRTNGTVTTSEFSDGWQGKFMNEKIIGKSMGIAPVPFLGNTTKGFWAIDETKQLLNITGNKKEDHYKVLLNASADINLIFSDRENNIWIANEPGVTKISTFNIQSFLFDELAAAGGALGKENDSSIWASNSKYLYRIVNNTIQKVNLIQYPKDYYGPLILDIKKNLWVGMWNGGLWYIGIRKGKRIFKKYFDKFNGKEIIVSAIVTDNNENIWVAGINGIFRVQNNHVMENYHMLNASGNPAFITSAVLDEKNKIMWLGDNEAGIIKLKYTLEGSGNCAYRVLAYINHKNGLNDTYIRSLSLDYKNNLWVGTRSGGIYQIKETNNTYEIINYNKAANISCTRVTDIQMEDTIAAWFATCNGIFRYNFLKNEWTQYSTGNGLLNAEVFNISVVAKNDFVWALTSQGVTKIKINTKENIVPPIINITGINVLGNPDSKALLSNAGMYSYTQNSIGFSFAGASFIDEKKIFYKYMLQGYDKQWSDAVITNNINYASLPPGNYTFKVLAANARGQWSTNPATFQFQIVMPVYKRPWFIFLLIIVFILIVYFIRVQQLKQRFKIEKLRLTIARDLHDDVGSTLGSINLLSKNATRRLDKHVSSEEIKPVFKKIGESAENTLEAMDDIVWSINPQKDKVQDIIIRMREFAIPLLEAKDIQFSFVIEADKEITMPMNLRRNAFLIFKESIYNIIKHAGAGKVGIKFHADHHRVWLEINDDGKGFDPDSPTERNGLKNMTYRAKMVTGTVLIHTSPSGTSIQFEAPLR